MTILGSRRLRINESFLFVWANAPDAEGHVAVVAKHTETWGKGVLHEPSVKDVASFDIELPSVFRPVPLDVIHGKELNAVFLAARALWGITAVVLQDCELACPSTSSATNGCL
jgi:hypothetical protein